MNSKIVDKKEAKGLKGGGNATSGTGTTGQIGTEGAINGRPKPRTWSEFWKSIFG